MSKETQYPAWFRAFLDAPTADVPGYFGDWMDIGCKIEETEDSISLYGQPDMGGPYNERPEVTFYGDQEVRRLHLVRWIYGATMTGLLVDAAKKYPDVRAGLKSFELPIRLTFVSEFAEEILGSKWK